MHAQTPVLTYRCATPATSGIGRLAWGWDRAGTWPVRCWIVIGRLSDAGRHQI